VEPGKFTNARGIAGGQGSLQANLAYWLDRASEMRPSCEGWARSVAKNRGIGGMRAIMSLVSLLDRHSFAAINRACEGLWPKAPGACRAGNIVTVL